MNNKKYFKYYIVQDTKGLVITKEIFDEYSGTCHWSCLESDPLTEVYLLFDKYCNDNKTHIENLYLWKGVYLALVQHPDIIDSLKYYEKKSIFELFESLWGITITVFYEIKE